MILCKFVECRQSNVDSNRFGIVAISSVTQFKDLLAILADLLGMVQFSVEKSISILKYMIRYEVQIDCDHDLSTQKVYTAQTRKLSQFRNY